MAFYLLLVLHHFDVVVHLFGWCQYDSFTFFVKLGTACTTEDLLNIENTKVFVTTSRAVIYFGPFDQNRISREVHTPGKRACRTEHFDVAIHKHALDKISIFPQHACMMSAETVLEQLLHLVVLGGVNFFFAFVRVFAVK